MSRVSIPVLGSDIGALVYLILEFALAAAISIYYFYGRWIDRQAEGTESPDLAE